MVKLILMDIEGTTTSISFVHETLFPYAKKMLASFVQANAGRPQVAAILAEVKKTVLEETGEKIDVVGCLLALESWIAQDRKHTALKELQGLLWKKGYEDGTYRGHLYEDVLPAWEKWRTAGLKLAIYSSGSVEAQKQIFGFNQYGNLLSYLSAHFDTKVGGKKESASYREIAKQLSLPPQSILFLSDMSAELEAAQTAGMQVCQILRPGTQADERFPSAQTFDQIVL
jgi:enolase-phosphatase E1